MQVLCWLVKSVPGDVKTSRTRRDLSNSVPIKREKEKNLVHFHTHCVYKQLQSCDPCICVCVCVFPTSKVSLGEEVLDEVSVSGEEEVVQLVYTHADRSVDVQPPAQVGAERLHFTCRDRKQERFC